MDFVYCRYIIIEAFYTLHLSKDRQNYKILSLEGLYLGSRKKNLLKLLKKQEKREFF